MRKGPTELPQASELKEILRAETKREVPKGKIGIHYADFSSVIKLLEGFRIDSALFTKSHSKKEIEEPGLLKAAEQMIEKAVDAILASSTSPRLDLFDGAYSYLSEEETPEASDLIFVFGSKSTARVEKAVELYKLNLAPRIMISGANPIYESHKDLPEALRLETFAIHQGVPASHFIIEPASISIPDNVKSSLALLDELGLAYKSLILVNSPFSQRRGWCHFMKFLAEGITIYRVNAKVSEKYSQTGWHKNEEGIKIVLNEFVKMKVAVSLDTA